MMDLELSKEQLSIKKMSENFAKLEILPFLDEIENDLNKRKSIFQKMALQGLFLLDVPQESGGFFVDSLAYVLALKAIAFADAGVAVTMSVTNMVAECISRFGSDEQKQKYLSPISLGQSVPAAFALTESYAGSDAKSIQTEAKRDVSHPGIFILNGEKRLITNGDLAAFLIVMAKTNPNDQHQGVSAFLIDAGTQGFSVTKKEKKLGLLSANLVSLKFENCRVSEKQMLGKEGDGLKIAFSALDNGRMGIAAQSLGIAEAAYEAALKYAKSRQQFGRPIGHHQAIAFKLADMRVKLNAGRLLILETAYLRDRERPYSVEASIAKLYNSEISNEIATEALQIHGGYGYTKNFLVEKYFRDARATSLYEGTSEIQRLIISHSLLK